MSTTTDLSVLKINYLTQAQYDNAKSQGTLEANEIYMTPVTDPGVTDVEVDGVSVVTDGVAEITMPTVPTKVSQLQNDVGFIVSFTETDPTVPSWAKQSSKPSYTAAEVGALPDTTSIPSKTSDLTNDSGFITGYTETDPTVPAWAKASSKPSYTASEVGAVPTTRKVNGKALSSDITLSASDVSALPASTSIPSKTSDLTNDSGFITGYTETDPTVPSWAKASSKPSYTASEVGAVPTTRTVNGKALSANISLDASDVGALPDSTVIPTVPTNVSAFTNDAGYLTDVTIDSSVVTLYTNLGLISS